MFLSTVLRLVSAIATAAQSSQVPSISGTPGSRSRRRIRSTAADAFTGRVAARVGGLGARAGARLNYVGPRRRR